MYLQHFGLREPPFARMLNTRFFIVCHKAVMVVFAKVGVQVQADLNAPAADDTEGVAMPLAIYRPVYIAFAGIAPSAAAVAIYVAGVLKIPLGRTTAQCPHA